MKIIFPFDNNSFIFAFGNMHNQIMVFYYHFLDSVYYNNWLSYYILSQFSQLIFVVPRDSIFLMVYVIIKIIACNIICLYFLRTY